MNASMRLMIVLVPVLVLTGCATLGRPDDPWLGRDKAYHFAIGAAVGAAVTAAAGHHGADDAEACAVAVAVTMSIGAGKEWVDRDVRKKFWSWKDLAWDLAGALAGSLIAAGAD
ncbi:MAG: hypothetical protein V1873_08515 [Verrucomicrobiota bacterium]